MRPILMKGHERPLTFLKYNRDGDLLFSCAKDHTPTVCADQTAKLWDVKTGQELVTFRFDAPARSVDLAIGDHLAVITTDSFMGNMPTAQVKRIAEDLQEQTEESALVISGITGRINRAVWGPGNRTIITAGEDATIRIWDSETLTKKLNWNLFSKEYEFASMMVSKLHTIYCGDTHCNQKCEDLVPCTVSMRTYVMLLPNFLCASCNQSTQTCDGLANSDEQIQEMGKKELKNYNASNNEKIFLAWGIDTLTFNSDQGLFKEGNTGVHCLLFGLLTGKLLKESDKEVGHQKAISSLSKSLDWSHFLTGSLDKSAKLWDARTLTLIKTYVTERPVNAVDISPTLDHVVIGGGQDAMNVTMTDRRAGKFEAKFFHKILEEEIGGVKGHFGPINALAFNPDGRSNNVAQ
uniref:Serine-threonine kinase receptor-associated protein n=1 Tax=Aegilops tauschii TaxID=37682 RepID=N1R5T8_AEGTA